MVNILFLKKKITNIGLSPHHLLFLHQYKVLKKSFEYKFMNSLGNLNSLRKRCGSRTALWCLKIKSLVKISYFNSVMLWWRRKGVSDKSAGRQYDAAQSALHFIYCVINSFVFVVFCILCKPRPWPGCSNTLWRNHTISKMIQRAPLLWSGSKGEKCDYILYISHPKSVLD